MTINLSNIKFLTIFMAISYILGIVCAFYNLEILITSLFILLLIFLTIFSNLNSKRIIILCFVFFLGLFRTNQSLNINSYLEGLKANNVALEGQIVSSSDISIEKSRIKFFLKVQKANVLGEIKENLNEKVLVNLDLEEGIEKDIAIGDYIKIKGALRTPKEARNPHQFDYKRYLLIKDCKSILYGDYTTFKKLKEPKFGKNKNDSWYYVLKKFEITRNKILEKHSKYIKSPKLEILGGIVFGNETINPDEQIKENFKNAGLLHLLAASGLNVALIYGIWWWIASLIRFPYNLSICLGACFVILYTFMTGFPPSILRASLMLLFVIFGKIINRNADSVALVSFVGLLMLACEPKLLFDIGFQLSFIVTLGLVTACPIVFSKFEKAQKNFIEKHKNLSRYKKYFLYLFSPMNLVSIITIPLVAQICVIPLQIYYFNNLSLLSLFANIAVVPFVGILSFIGFVGSIFALFPFLDNIFVYLFDLVASPLLGALINISEFFASFKYSLISTSGLNIFQVFNFWLIAFLFLLNFKNNFTNKKQTISLFMSIFILFFSFINFDNLKKDLTISMFDVENADCFLIKTPENKFIMIDTGKKIYRSNSDAQNIINKYLKNKRIKNLELLIVTHFDMDHCGGVIDILKNFKANAVSIQDCDEASNLQKEIINYLDNNKIKTKKAINGEVIYQENDLIIKTFVADFGNKKVKSRNETSTITLLTYKNNNILFMADCGYKAFEKIKHNLPKKINIIKVGHHGANQSINLKMLNEINPEYALISVGENKFNHPSLSILKLLFENNIKTVISKDYGFSQIKIENDKINFYYFDNKNKKFKEIIFKEKEIPFYQTQYFQNYVKNNI